MFQATFSLRKSYVLWDFPKKQKTKTTCLDVQGKKLNGCNLLKSVPDGGVGTEDLRAADSDSFFKDWGAELGGETDVQKSPKIYLVERSTKAQVDVFCGDLSEAEHAAIGRGRAFMPAQMFLLEVPDTVMLQRVRTRGKEYEKNVPDAYLLKINRTNKQVFEKDPRTVIFDGRDSPSVLAYKMHREICRIASNFPGAILTISIEGGIGSGKSTVLAILAKMYGYHTIPEPTETFWAEPLVRFYKHPIENGKWFQKCVSDWYTLVANCLGDHNLTWEAIQTKLRLK